MGVEKSYYWPGNIAGQGAHFQGSDLVGKQTFPRGHSFWLPSSSGPGRYSAPHSEPGPLAQPPISGACAPGPGARGGLVLSSFLSLPFPPPGATATQNPGLRGEESAYLVGVTCCPGPAQESPPGPGARRGPQPGQAAPAPHPRPAPAAGREGGTGFS